MGSKVEYVDSSHMYATNYIRNSKAVGVLWGIFTICYAIICFVAFVTPEWIGSSNGVEAPARFGLWRTCYFASAGRFTEDCNGRIEEIFTIHNVAFKIAAVFCAASILVAALTVVAMLFFFFFTSTTVFKICGCLQIISGVCITVTVLVYPLGWGAKEVKKTCGHLASPFHLAECSMGWAYPLALMACLDAIILATLAFILATRHVKLQPETSYPPNGSLYKGEVNGGFMGEGHSIAGSRKSLNLHPVLLMPQPGSEVDRYSEFSNRTGRSKSSAYRAEYASSMQNFQL